MKRSLPYIPVFRFLTGTLIAFAMSSCNDLPDRLNHMHNDANYEKAKSASANFDAIRSERTGLSAKMRANLGAQRQLRQAVAAESHKFFNRADLHLVEDITWGGLQKELWAEIGWRGYPDFIRLLATMDKIQKDKGLSNDEKEQSLKNGTILANAFLGTREISRPDLVNDWVDVPIEFFLNNPLNRDETPFKHYELNTEDLDSVRALNEEHIEKFVREFNCASSDDLNEIVKLIDPSLLKELDPNKPVTATAPEAFGQRIRPDGKPEEKQKAGKDFLCPPEAKDNETPTKALAKAMHQVATAVLNQTFQKQIEQRLQKLAVTLKLFEVLIKGERTRIALLLKSQQTMLAEAKRELKLPANGKNNTGATGTSGATGSTGATGTPSIDLNAALDLVFGIQGAISDYWKDEQNRKKYLTQANQLQRQLVLAAEESRDPAAVYSLVPLAGEGLSQDDLDWLDEYINFLKVIEEKLKKKDEKFPGKMDKLDATINSQLGTKECNGQSITDNAMGKKDGFSKKDDINLLCKVKDFRDAYKSLTSLLAGLDNRTSDTDDNIKHNKLNSVMEKIIQAADKLELDIELASFSEIGKQLSDLQEPLANVLQQGELDSDNVKSLLKLVVGSNSAEKLDEDVDKAISKGKVNVDALQALMNDVAQESQTASKQVVDLLSALQALNKRIRDENVRHYLSLSGIARSEVERWEDLRGLSYEFSRVYNYQRPDDPNKSSMVLFNSRQDCTNQKKQKIMDPPRVCLSDDVLSSIRRLAATAHYYQTSIVPQETDFQGKNTRSSVVRLAQANGILHIYQLMTTLNRYKASENSIELFGEVQEHAIQLDEILVASVEAEIGYGLGKLEAFHSSGITQDDLKVLVGLIQSGLLVWIGSGVT